MGLGGIIYETEEASQFEIGSESEEPCFLESPNSDTIETMDSHVTTSIAIAAIPSLLTLIVGLWVGRARDSEKAIFNKKLEIYSDIVYHLSSARYLQLNLHFSEEKLESLVKEFDLLKEGRSRGIRQHTFDTELETVDRELHKLNYRDELIKLFAPARLIGSGAVVNELREYYSLISEYHTIEEKKDLDDLTKKISKSIMELEQLMRKDLGRSRLVSRLDIWWHLHKD